MRADLSTLGVESVGGGRVILHGRSRWLFLALAAVVLLITLQSARIGDRKSTRLNSSHVKRSRMPSSA